MHERRTCGFVPQTSQQSGSSADAADEGEDAEVEEAVAAVEEVVVDEVAGLGERSVGEEERRRSKGVEEERGKEEEEGEGVVVEFEAADSELDGAISFPLFLGMIVCGSDECTSSSSLISVPSSPL